MADRVHRSQRGKKEHSMTPRNVLRRWRDAIHRVRKRWWPSHPPATTVHSSAAVAEVVLDVEETDEALIVLADLPGLKPGDCTVEATGEWLVIRGEQKWSAAHGHHICAVTELHDGAFARTLHLPCDIDPEKARATYENGVLQIVLPKTTRATSTRVQINV
jgi:HSP20 family protein